MVANNIKELTAAQAPGVSWDELAEADSRPVPEYLKQGKCPDLGSEPLSTERYTSAVVATCEGLALFPLGGVPREDIRPGLRVTHHKGRTVIAYAVDENARTVSSSGCSMAVRITKGRSRKAGTPDATVPAVLGSSSSKRRTELHAPEGERGGGIPAGRQEPARDFFPRRVPGASLSRHSASAAPNDR